ncbi:glycosyltransferase family 4 protein [Blastococcus haudaquaticus]|uniref:Glycosyltransferase involved in cell wall bisynthesis n=1 Tax=Blastococcus haudaquaticus TaxID=1938745 RepID=A0A286GE29_9ACTN|nr:glycosyltransferase family 1 protein [Blastococcus haudaquaticus]SOD93752.1 Glycosyltransferase involved in cell wall bisynthesis [Blastococcus haudaquaticus]
MRVAVLLEQVLAPVPAGTGRYSTELAGALATTAPDGAAVTGWTAWHRRTAAARLPGVSGPRRLPLPRRALVAAWERGVGPRPTGADVVHAPTLLLPPVRRGALVVTVHDAVPWTHPETLTARGVRWHRAMAERAARHADAIVVPTHAVADDLARYLQPRAPIEVAHLGASGRLAEPDDAAERARRLGLPEEPFLLSLATLEPRKGLDVLIEALAHPAGPDVPLLLVGQPGWGGVAPDALAARAGLPPGRVRSLGRLADADLAVVLRRATALVAPSRAEGFGLPVLEAMTAGTAVVSSDDPALAEVGGGATLLTPVGEVGALAEAIHRVVDDAGLRSSLAARGTARAADFSWDTTARRMWELYGRL